MIRTVKHLKIYIFWNTTFIPLSISGSGKGCKSLSQLHMGECMVHQHLGVQYLAHGTSSALLWRCPRIYPLQPEHLPSFVCLGAWAAFNPVLLQTTTPYWYPNDDISGITSSKLYVFFWGKNVNSWLMFVFQQEKVYVQHRVAENAKLLWDLIKNKNGCFYIAGWVWGIVG